MNVLTDWFIPLYNTECVIHETNTISMNKQISETQNLGKYLRIFPELWSKLCQNIKTCKQTKMSDMQYKKAAESHVCK